MAFEQLSQKIAYRNPYYSVSEEEFNQPNGEVGVYYAIRGLKTVVVIPMLDSDTVIMEKQFRYLYQEISWELPAGVIETGESPESAAMRELEEEVGYRAGTLQYVGVFAPYNGLTDEDAHVFIATDLTKTEQQLDPGEAITVQQVSVDELWVMIETNTFREGMSIAAWTMAQAKIKQLQL